MPLNPKPLKIVGERGAKNPSYICGSTKNQVTVLACTSASGYALPPYVILARKTLNQEITYGEVAATSYGLSPKGWWTLRCSTSGSRSNSCGGPLQRGPYNF